MQPLPAHPWTVAAYARWCESRKRRTSIAERVRAIARAHLLAGAPSPDRHSVVQRTLSLIEARERTRGQRAGLFPVVDVTGDAAGEMTSDGAGDAAGGAKDLGHTTGGQTAGQPTIGPAASRRPRGLRSSPRLVRRRPKTIPRT